MSGGADHLNGDLGSYITGADTVDICAYLSLNNVIDAEAFPGLIRQTHRKVKVASADGAYDTKLYHDELWRKNKGAYPAANLGSLLGRLEREADIVPSVER